MQKQSQNPCSFYLATKKTCKPFEVVNQRFGHKVVIRAVVWAPVFLNAAVQFQTAKKSRAPVPARLIDQWHRRGQGGCRRWTLRTLPQPHLSCQLPLTHCCLLLPRSGRPVKEKSPSPRLNPASLSVWLFPPHPLLSTSTHIRGKHNPCIRLILPLVLPEESEHINMYILWSSDPGCSNSRSPHFSKSQFILGFVQVSLILAWAPLFRACLFFSAESFPLLVFHHLRSGWTLLLQLGPGGPRWTPGPIWGPGCCSHLTLAAFKPQLQLWDLQWSLLMS